MSTWLLVGCCVVLSLVVGCAKSGQQPSKSETAEIEFEVPSQSTPAANSPVVDSQLASELEENDYSPEKEQQLLAKLKQSPDDTKVLLHLARLTQVKALKGDDEYAAYKKSAQYVHRALDANPAIAETEVFRDIAGTAFYNEACAFSREEQDEASLKSLQLAVEYDESCVSRIAKDDDLQFARQSPGYVAFELMLRDKHRSRIAAIVKSLFQNKPDFSFDFDLIDTDGQPFKKADFVGKVLMVNIWGTWCGPCLAELPDLIAAHEKYQASGFEIVGLNQESETGSRADRLINTVQKQQGIKYRCALANDATLSQIPKLRGIPTSLFLDREGKVLAMTVGRLDALQLELIIERLLKESPPQNQISDTTK